MNGAKEQSIMRTRERRPDLYKNWLENIRILDRKPCFLQGKTI